MITVRGAVVGWTPTVAGASGLARCKNDSASTAMMGRIYQDSWTVKYDSGVQVTPS
jgi:hypothetical protein